MPTPHAPTAHQILENNLEKEPMLNFEPLAKNYSTAILIQFLLFFIPLTFVGLGVSFLVLKSFEPILKIYIYLPYLALIASVFIYAPLFAKAKGLALCKNEIHFKSGIIWKKTTSLTFNRIQHIEMESNPLERFFKHTTLKFYTAGGGGVDMKIPALNLDRATRLRAFVMQKAGLDESDNLITANV